MGTKVLKAAQARLATLKRERLRAAAPARAFRRGKMTTGDCLAIYRERPGKRANRRGIGELKDTSRHYYLQVTASIERRWPGLSSLDAARVSDARCREWAEASLASASATRHNAAVQVMTHLFTLAIEAGVRAD